MTATAAAAQMLTPEELEQARHFLKLTETAVIGATKGLSDAQWHFKPAPDRWSIAENLDHIVAVQERVLGPILNQLAEAPPPPEGWNYQAADSIIIHQFGTRLGRYSAPEFVLPQGSTAPAELLRRLSANYARFAQILETTPGLRQHAIDSPPLKAISQGAFPVADGYQWILAAAAHTERHAKQMIEVMADPSYPV
jgi:hypothetical protein